VGVDTKTIQSYFKILEDTLLGFFLLAHHPSFRKRFSRTPSFFSLTKEFPNSKGYLLSLDPAPQKIGSVHVLPWQEGLKTLGFN
jgi:hypothetical protein